MELEPWHHFETNGSSATVQIWDVEGMNGGAGSEEGGIAKPWDKHQLFGAIPLTVFLAEGKDGLACWEQLFFTRGASWSLFLVQTGVQVALTLRTCRGTGLVFPCFSGRWRGSWEQSPNLLRDLSMEDS